MSRASRPLVHGLVLAAVTIAGFTVTIRSGHRSPQPISAAEPPAAVTQEIAAFLPSQPPAQAPAVIRAAVGLSPVVTSQRAQGAAPSVSPAPTARSVSGATAATPPAAQSGPATAAETPTLTPAPSSTPPPESPRAALDLNPDTGLRGSSAASAPGQPTPTPTPAPTPAEPTEIVFYHEVQPGETLGGIAQRYGISTASLLAINPLVVNKNMLKPGLKLYVPTKEGILYFVRYGDTVSELAERFKVKPEDIVGFKPNGLASADSIREGELVLIPGGTAPPPPPPPPTPSPRPTPAPTPAPARPAATAAPAAVRAAASTPAPAPPAPAAPTPAPPPARPATAGFIWPITGPLSSYFGAGHPLGIDIDLYGRAGTPIVAAKAGTVVFAGGNACCSYGYYTEIDHGDGTRTLYAHFQSPPPVRIGQQVAQGQVVGYAGTTGYSTGVHLHFEIRRNGTPLNPLGFLP